MMTDQPAGLPQQSQRGGPDLDDGLDGDGLAYADALVELEGILDALEADQVDVDTLAANVERAAVLIRLCRARLGSARAKVDAIVDELERETDDDAG
jgi:exodeoxyribonuclease VII small subunit